MKQFLSLSFVFFGISCQEIRASRTFHCKEITNNTPLLDLKQYLFCNYDQDVRPTKDHRNTTVVSIQLEVQHFEVDEVAKMIDLHVWTKMMWTDPHLTWEPSLFDSIDAIRVMSYEIWVPDVTLHSATNQYVDINMPTVRCYLYHQGTLYCVPMTVYTTHCESDHTWWPYDLMNCSIHIASWSYSNDEIDVRFMHVQRESQLTEKVYENNLQWDIVEIHQSEHTINSKFGLGFASKLLSFHIFLKRHSSMYSQIYLTLAIVLMAMTLMVLWLDPRSIERMIIANLNLILHLFSLQDLQWKIPSNGTALPKLLIFYENSFILATFSLMLTNILRCIQQLKVQAPVWISSASISIFNSRIGQVLLMNILDPHISARMELYADDNTILVTSTERSGTWKYISILIGWFAFTSILFVYIIMLVLLLPTSTCLNSLVLNS